MNELEQLRTQIDQIDQEIIKLIATRRDIVIKIGEYKKACGIEVLDKSREDFLKSRYEKLSIQYHLDSELIKSIFNLIIKKSRELEEKI